MTVTSQAGNVSIYDNSGKIIKSNSITSGFNSFSMNQKGLYILVFKSIEGKIASRKINLT